jgi:hypothetical protein
MDNVLMSVRRLEELSIMLVSARQLEELGIMKKGTAFRMVKAGKLIHYKVGCAGGGIRFRVDEVLAALRQTASSQEARPK